MITLEHIKSVAGGIFVRETASEETHFSISIDAVPCLDPVESRPSLESALSLRII